MMKKAVAACLLIVTIVTLTPCVSHAQCPMCKASVESSMKSSTNKIGLGLNDGILYLLVVPYIAVGVIGYLWYKKYRRRDVEIEVKDEPISLN